MNSTLMQWLNGIEYSYSEKTAYQYVFDGEVKSVSFLQYVEDVKRFAMWMKNIFPETENVHFGILAKNSYRYMVCLLGIIFAKGIAVPLNWEETPEVLKYQVHHADIEYLFTDETYEMREAETFSLVQMVKGVFALEESCEGGENVGLVESYDVDKLALILFTSGTTSKSRAVMISQRNLLALIKGCEETVSGMSDSDGVLSVLPLYHISGIGTFLLNNTLGVTIGLCSDIKYMYRDIKLLKSSSTSVVPIILKAWAGQIKRGHIDKLGNLKMICCGAAEIDTETLNVFRECGIQIFTSYGLSEVTGTATINTLEKAEKMKSVGIPVKGCEIKIVDGEVCLRSESVFCGYYKEPEETAKVLVDGWLHTGDLGYQDEDGFLFLTGRKKTCIILSSGENVMPEELEELLERSPLVREALVTAQNDKLCATIVCNALDEMQIREDIAELNRSLTLYKRITKVEFTDKALLRTTNGKKIRR